MSITECIRFLIEMLVEVMSSAPVFPFVGFALGASILVTILQLFRRENFNG